MKDVFEEALRLMSAGEPAALSTIVSSKGSLPMSKKAKMLVQEDGTIIGTVGGGCLEADVWSEARAVMESGRSSLQTFILTEEHAGADGLNCGGNVEVFTEPVVSGTSEEIFREIATVRAERATAVLATLVSAESDGSCALKLLVREDGTTVGSLGEAALDQVVQDDVRKLETISEDLLKVIDVDGPAGEPTRIFLESIWPEPTLYLFGGGHVSFAIARVAATVGFRIVIIDDRPMFANKERFPMADETLVLDMESAFEHLAIDDLAYVCAVTRGHQFDKPVVEQAIRTDAAYIGMLGSRRKVALMWKAFEAKGIPRERLEEIHAPIGLDIGSDNPEEIAVSVVAELIRVRRSAGKPAHQVASMSAVT